MTNRSSALKIIDRIAWWVCIIWFPAQMILILIPALSGQLKADPTAIYNAQPGNTLPALILPIAIATGIIVFHRVRFKLPIVTWFLLAAGFGLAIEIWQYAIEGLQQRYFGYIIAVPIGVFFVQDYIAHSTAVQILGRFKGFAAEKGFLVLAVLTGIIYAIIATSLEFIACDELDLWRWTIRNASSERSVLYNSIPSGVPMAYFTISLTISALRYRFIGNPMKASGRDSWQAGIPCIILWIGFVVLNLTVLTQDAYRIGLTIIELLFIALVIWSLSGSAKSEKSLD